MNDFNTSTANPKIARAQQVAARIAAGGPRRRLGDITVFCPWGSNRIMIGGVYAGVITQKHGNTISINN